jgi:hypothetical protein
MAGLPFLKFYPADWMSDPALSMCSASTRGLWMDALCIMHENEAAVVKGSADQLCRVLRCSAADLELAIVELRETKAAEVSRNLSQICFTNRRRKREISKSRKCSIAGRLGGGNPKLSKGASKGASKGGPKHPSDICNMSSSLSSVLDGGCKGETARADPGEPLAAHSNGALESDPLTTKQIWLAYPRQGRAAWLRSHRAISEALAIIAGRGERGTAAWLLARVEAFAKSPAGNAGKFTTTAPNWFADGKYDDDPAAWQRAEGDAPKPLQTAEEIARMCGVEKP